jgi:hypothetical protein
MVTSLVLIHCATWTETAAAGSSAASARIMLRFGNVGDEVARFLVESGQEGRREFLDIPLDYVLSLLISRSRNPNMMVLIDTWAAARRAGDNFAESHHHHPFALIYAKSVSEAPFLFSYAQSGAAVETVHSQGGALQHMSTRGVLLEELTAVVAACASPSQLDCLTVATSLVAFMSSRHSALGVHRVLPSAATGTPFAPLFVPVEKLKEIFHHLSTQQRPFVSPAPLHVERRHTTGANTRAKITEPEVPSSDVSATGSSVSHVVKPSALKWKHVIENSLSFRGSSHAARFPLRTQVAAPAADLLKVHLKMEANVPRAAFAVDMAVEDESYHSRDNIEDDGIEWAKALSRRIYSACVTIDENYVWEERLSGSSNPSIIPIAIGQEPNIEGSSFSITVAPPALGSTAAADSDGGDLWHVDGVRLASEKLLRVEAVLVLDVKKGAPQGPIEDSYERVTAALDPLAHSIKRKLQELLETLDAQRLAGALRVVYAADVWRAVEAADDNNHFRANISVGVIVHDREPELRHVVHTRRLLTDLLRRFPRRGGQQDPWIPCAEQTTLPQPTTAVFRCARLFHVLRGWRCAVQLNPATPFHLQSARCEYIGHLLRRIVVLHSGIGAQSPATGLVLRLLDVRAVNPDPDEASATFGPHLMLNEVPEEHISAAISAAWRVGGEQQLSPPAAPSSINFSATMNASRPGTPQHDSQRRLNESQKLLLSPAKSLAAAFSSRPTPFDTLVILCWCFPKHFSGGVGGGGSLLSMYTASVMQSFHSKLRPTTRGGMACLVTCGFPYALPTGAVPGELAVDYAALEANFMRALLDVGGGSMQLPVSASTIRRLPLHELAPNKDEDTGDEPAATAPGQQESQCEEAPYAEDETYRPLPNARLMKKSLHARNPLGTLCALPLSFWHSVRDACRAKLAANVRCSAGVSLVAAVLKNDGSPAAVHSLTDATEPLAADLRERITVETVPPALRPDEIESFVQYVLSQGGAEHAAAAECAKVPAAAFEPRQQPEPSPGFDL